MDVPQKPIERPMDVNVWDLVSQVIESRRHPLDLVREHLSNMCSIEVKANEVRIDYTHDPKYGPTFIFTDDGIGMNYTGDMKNPGRLDKFLAVAYSGHAGVPTDEFGQKGIGAKLSMNCRRLEIRTKSQETGQSFYVFVDRPLELLRKGQQPKYQIYEGGGPEDYGTEVRVYGYENETSKKDFDFESIKRYLFFSAIVGHTRSRTMPEVSLNVLGIEEILKTGFPYLINPAIKDWKTYVIPAPIIKKDVINNTTVTVTLKGGFTLETGNEKVTGPYTLTPKTSGLFLSIKGIPYLRLDLNQFKGNFSTLQYKFCRFVAECDELFDHMDFARLSYQSASGIGSVAIVFEKLLRECFNELAERPEWKTFLRERELEKQCAKRISLDERKKALQEPEQKYVFLKDSDRLIHRVPSNENDALALLWKLEGARAIPIDFFESLEHTAAEGIDMLANFRIRMDGDTQHVVPVEVEDTFEEFIDHGHNPNQTGAIICWMVEDPESPELEQSDLHYLMFYKTSDRKIPVLIMQRFNTIEVKTLAKK